MLLTFANSLDPDQAQQNVGPNLGPLCLTLINGTPERFFFEKVNFEKKNSKDKSMQNYSGCIELKPQSLTSTVLNASFRPGQVNVIESHVSVL